MFHYPLRLFSVLCLVLALTACNDTKDNKEKYMIRGDKLFEQEDYVRAKPEYKNAARISPTDPEVIYSLGLVEEAQGNMTQAFKAFMVAEQQDRNFAPVVSKLVHYFMVAQRYDDVEKRVDHLLDIDPDNATAHAIKGSLYLRKKDFDGAMAQVKKAQELEPDNVISYSVLAGIHSAKGKPQQALVVLDEGLKHKPAEVSLHLLKAAVYGEQNDIENVADVYRKLFELYPNEPRYRFDLVQIFSDMGENDKAQDELREIINFFPDNLKAKHDLVQLLETLYGLDAAANEIKKYMSAQPQKKVMYIWLADLYSRHNKDTLAVQTLNSLIENNADEQISLNASTLLAYIQLRKGDVQRVENLVNGILKKDVNSKDALFIRSNLLFQKANYQSAVSDLRRIINEDQTAVKAYHMLTEIFIIQGHMDLAIDTLTDAIRYNPDDLSGHVRLAQLYALRGDNQRAEDLLDIVTKSNPSYMIGWENKARVAIQQKQWSAAHNAIEKLEALGEQKHLVMFLRGQIQDGMEEYNDARRFYQHVIAANPDSALSAHALSALLALSEKTQDIEKTQDFLGSLQTDNAQVAAALGGIHLALNEINAAEAYFKKAVANQPQTQAPYILYAQILMEKGRNQEALKVLNQARSNLPHEIGAPVYKANYLAQSGNIDEAIAIYEALYQRSNKVDLVANNMAQLIADHKSDDKDAMEKARIAAERFVNSDSPAFLDTLGWVYFRQGRFAQAYNILSRAVSLSPAPLDPQISYHYGSVLLKMDGRKDEAKKYLKQALVEGADYHGIEDARELLYAVE